jgi:large subunit ribosomal protein L15e
MPNAYHHIGETWKKHEKDHGTAQWDRLVAWRDGPSFVKVDKPLRLDRARALGYKAKQGVIVVRARVRRGGLRKQRFVQGRVPSKMGVNKITMRHNIQAIAEVRVAKHFPNLEVLNSYYIGEDGKNHYYEVILLDPYHPSIESDKQLGWITQANARNRVLRGKTSAGQKHRGLRWTGTGSEHTRPSVRKSVIRKKTNRLVWSAKNKAKQNRL